MQNYGPHLRPILSACLWVRPRVTISSTNIYLLKFKYFNIAQFWLLFSCTKFKPMFSSVQSLSRVVVFATPWTTAHQASLSITNSRSLLKLMSTESVMPSKPSHPLLHLFSCLQSFLASGPCPMCQFFASGGQSGASASASVLTMNIQGWFPLGMTGYISLLS